MSDAAELLPCPFCGSSAELHSIEGHRPNSWTHAVYCTDDDCGGGVELFDDKDVAASRWNRRTHPHHRGLRVSDCRPPRGGSAAVGRSRQGTEHMKEVSAFVGDQATDLIAGFRNARISIDRTGKGVVVYLTVTARSSHKHAKTVILDDRRGFSMDVDEGGRPMGFELLSLGDDLQIEVPLSPDVLVMAVAAYAEMDYWMRQP